MISFIENNEAALVFLLRIILGMLFFFQGYDKVFNIKIPGVMESFNYELGTIKINKWILLPTAFLTSYIELIGGVLLIIGFLKTQALYLLGIDLIGVTGAMSMIKPMWNMEAFFPRLVLLSALILLPKDWDLFSIDYMLIRK